MPQIFFDFHYLNNNLDKLIEEFEMMGWLTFVLVNLSNTS